MSYSVEHRRASRRKYHFVYKTTCLVTGRYYIGLHSTDDLEDVYLGSGVRLGRSIAKHGKENHKREILEMFESREAASEGEKRLITPAMLKDQECLNCGPGGLGATDRPATKEETRQKLSEASKNYVRTKEWYEKVVATRKANGTNTHTEETKRRLSEIQTGKVLSEEHKLKIADSLKGHEVSEETRKNLSKALKGNPKLQGSKVFSEEHKESIRAARIGKTHSEEAKANMRKPRKSTAKMCRPCTLDGVEIFPSVGALAKKYGTGRNGTRSPNFKYLEISV